MIKVKFIDGTIAAYPTGEHYEHREGDLEILDESFRLVQSLDASLVLAISTRWHNFKGDLTPAALHRGQIQRAGLISLRASAGRYRVQTLFRIQSFDTLAAARSIFHYEVRKEHENARKND